MCGICGELAKKDRKISSNSIELMVDKIRHRGPDDRGVEILSFFTEEDLGIGFSRLSIRDLSINGHQPMWNLNHDILITFNGEIYNSEELRERYLQTESFNSTSDTEVLLKMYEKFDIDFTLSVLDGMYAICIADLRQKCLFLIRDKLGEKPLYIYENEDTLLWSSEYKAFYENEFFTPILNEKAVTEYLMFRYLSDGETLLESVRNIRPGTYIKILDGKKQEVTYWNIGHSGKVNENVNIYSLLEKSVKRRMVSDVPIGIQLSGGVDSSLLAAFIKKNIDSFESYGIVFENEKFNEEQYMLHVDRTLGINTRKILFKESDFLQLWKDTTYYFENPVNHEGTLGLLYLNRVASHYNRVLLCGEGADELFGGYSWYGKFSYYLKHPVISCILRIHRNGVVELKRGLNESFIRETQYIDDAQVMRIYHKADTKSIIKKRRSILKNIKDKGLRKYMKYDMLTYMQDILMRGDKASMAASVELRIPYIMPEVVEYVCGLDDDTFVKISKSVEMDNLKIPLKRIAENIYGKTFTYREKKGFGIDLHSFFLQKNTKDYIEECLMPGIQRRGLFEYSVVKKIWDEEQEDNSTTKKTMMLWIILSFELWAQEYLD